MNYLPKVSVIIPTHNRPELVGLAISSVLNQTYNDLELIVVDVGLEKRADQIANGFNDSRLTYIKSDRELNGSAARNVGIKRAKGEFIAFLDDDDEWLPEKLAVQMREFENTSQDVGFCFSATIGVYEDRNEEARVYSGARNYLEEILFQLKGFLNVTLIVKKYVFDDVGFFDEEMPSHQETELLVRIAKKYKGLGVNRPLVRVNMKKGYEKLGYDLSKKAAGREMILEKHKDEFARRPKALANHYFQIGLWYRNDNQLKKAREYFKKAWDLNHKLIYVIHYLSLIGHGELYRLFR